MKTIGSNEKGERRRPLSENDAPHESVQNTNPNPNPNPNPNGDNTGNKNYKTQEINTADGATPQCDPAVSDPGIAAQPQKLASHAWPLDGKLLYLDPKDGPSPEWAQIWALVYEGITTWGDRPDAVARGFMLLPPGSDKADAVQAALTSLIRDWRAGKTLPPTLAEVVTVLVSRADNYLRSQRRRKSTAQKATSLHLNYIVETLYAPWLIGTFAIAEQNNLTDLFYRELLAAVDLPCKRLLKAWLKDGIPFEKSAELQHHLCLTEVEQVTNIKLRICYAAGPILERLLKIKKPPGGEAK